MCCPYSAKLRYIVKTVACSLSCWNSNGSLEITIVQLLSMKLASVDLKFCDLFTEAIGHVNQQQVMSRKNYNFLLDCCTNGEHKWWWWIWDHSYQETGSIPQLSVPVQSVLQSSAIQQVAFDEATGNSISHLLLHGGGATALPQVVLLHGQTFHLLLKMTQEFLQTLFLVWQWLYLFPVVSGQWSMSSHAGGWSKTWALQRRSPQQHLFLSSELNYGEGWPHEQGVMGRLSSFKPTLN